MIPKNIQRDHVLRAIEEIKTSGVPKDRESTKFLLSYDRRLYPPKFVLSIAARFATGQELLPSEFSGGDQANSFLEGLGFVIQTKNINWSWRECYFAVWAYDQLDLDRTQVKTVLYREIANIIDRTEKSVEFKIQNVSFFDPRPRIEKPISEASNAQALLGDVFRWY